MSIPFFENLRAGRPQTVVVYGTSLTQGGAWTRAMKSWLEERFPGLVTFVNSGGPGENSDWGLANVQEKVVAHQPDLVFIEFSYNDAHTKFEMPLERGAENLGKIVAAIREARPETGIVLQTMNVGWDAPGSNPSFSMRPQLSAFNENYRQCSVKLGLRLLDHVVAWQRLKEDDPETFRRFVPDGSHPSEEGSLAVTWPAVKTFLEEGTG